MAFIQDLTSQGYIHNRAPDMEIDTLDDYIHNRTEPIPPTITEQIVQVTQEIPDGGIVSSKLTIHDVGNAGISNLGDQNTDIRIWAGSAFANRATAPFYVTKAGALVATSATISGAITATSGTIGGWTINSTTITGGNVTLDSAGNIRFGKTGFSDTTNAGLIMGLNGATPTFYIGTASDASYMKLSGGVYDMVGTISSRSTLTISNSINSSGNLITDVINGRLDSSAKKILSDFNFGTTNYAGAVNAGNVTWNTSTGAITGGSGIIIYRSGIVGVNSGVTTFSIDSATGAATFAGTLSAPTGNFGGFTINASNFTATNFIVTSGAANTANITIGSGSNAAGINSANGSSDIAFWAGDTFANRAIAPFYVTAGGAMVATSATINGRAFTADPTFGDGSDGTVTLGAGTTTLTRDMFYDVLTIPNSAVLNPGGYKVFCKTSCTFTGTGKMSRDGNAGNAGANSVSGAITTGGAAATALASGSIFGGLAGVAGGNGGGTGVINGQPGTVGLAAVSSITNVAGVAGGAGHTGTNGTAGAAGTAGAITSVAIASVRNLANALLMVDTGNGSVLYRGCAGSGSGGGGGNNTGGAVAGGAGGSSGSTGGIVFLAARTITIGASASITVIGGVGGAGGNSQNVTPESGAGGGGGGGDGGIILLIYTTLSNSGSLNVSGGTAGAGGTNPANATYNGNASNNGNAGSIFQLQLS